MIVPPKMNFKSWTSKCKLFKNCVMRVDKSLASFTLENKAYCVVKSITTE